MEGIEGALVRRILATIGLILAGLALLVPGSEFYYESGSGKRCVVCHEMQSLYDQWHASSHRGLACEKCHGGALTLNASFHLNNAARLYSHLRGDLPEQIGFGNRFVLAMDQQCQACHRQEYAAWQSGPHSASYARIFLDRKHNTANMLMDDCLRCHGMHFEGGIRDLVTPVDRSGPWRLLTADLTNQPSMPCVTCHETHREGQPMQKTDIQGRVPGPSQEITRPSLAFFDRRSQRYIPLADLPMPAMLEGTASGQNESGPAPGSVLPVPCAGFHYAGGQRRRPHGNGRARRHQLPGVPRAARPKDQGFMRHLSPEDVELRP